MKRKTKILLLFIPLIIITAAVTVVTFAAASYKYVENCYYENKSELEELSEEIRDLLDGDKTYVSINIDEYMDNNPIDTHIQEILKHLNDQYQIDSEKYVFSSVTGYRDDNGRIMMYMIAKKEKTNGDGINTHDRRDYYLLYIDEGYDGYMGAFTTAFTMFDSDRKPFSGNWYTYSLNSYSG